MKVDFSQKILGPDGNETEFHLGKVALTALNTTDQKPLTLDGAIKRGTLALKVGEGGTHEITPEEAALIREQLPKVWAPIVVARAAEMLK